MTVPQHASYLTKHEPYHLPCMEATRRAIAANRGVTVGLILD